MAYRITYQVNVDWVGPGVGPMGGAMAPSVGMAAAGGAQRKTFFNGTAAGQNSNTFTGTDITNLLASMTTDLSTQMNANITQIQNFSTGTG